MTLVELLCGTRVAGARWQASVVWVKMSTSSGCYCGVATKANRYKWATAVLLMALGTVFLVLACIAASICEDSHEYLGVLLLLHGKHTQNV